MAAISKNILANSLFITTIKTQNPRYKLRRAGATTAGVLHLGLSLALIRGNPRDGGAVDPGKNLRGLTLAMAEIDPHNQTRNQMNKLLVYQQLTKSCAYNVFNDFETGARNVFAAQIGENGRRARVIWKKISI